MSSSGAASLEAFSLAVLRDLVGTLLSEVARLRADNAALHGRAEAQRATIAALSAETQALRDEVARLKGLPPRPPSRPLGMGKATSRGTGKGGGRSRRRRGAKRDRDAGHAEGVVKAAGPAGSRCKGSQIRKIHV